MCRQSEIPAFFGPAFRFRHDLFSLAEVFFGVAEDAVGLGQVYPQGSSLVLSSIRA